jgi:Tfp pilus assembly protein PilX
MMPMSMQRIEKDHSIGGRTAGAGSRQRGVALFVGLVFLVMLSLVAIVVMKDTLLETRMTTATARHEQAFEASETGRLIPETILAAHVFNRGWPTSWGGSIPDSAFDLNATFGHRPDWIKLLDPATTSGEGLQSCGGVGLVIFYMPQACATHADNYMYTPSAWDASVVMTTCSDGSATCASNREIKTTVAMIRDGVTVNKGSGAAQSMGYASIGVGTAKGGSALYLQIRSDARVPGNGRAATIAQYKLNIDH